MKGSKTMSKMSRPGCVWREQSPHPELSLSRSPIAIAAEQWLTVTAPQGWKGPESPWVQPPAQMQDTSVPTPSQTDARPTSARGGDSSCSTVLLLGPQEGFPKLDSKPV